MVLILDNKQNKLRTSDGKDMQVFFYIYFKFTTAVYVNKFHIQTKLPISHVFTYLELPSNRSTMIYPLVVPFVISPRLVLVPAYRASTRL